MQKISTMQMSGNKTFKGQLTVGLDLGDRSSSDCVLDEAGEVVFERKLATTTEANENQKVRPSSIPVRAYSLYRTEGRPKTKNQVCAVKPKRRIC
jgi:hypothetical protein